MVVIEFVMDNHIFPKLSNINICGMVNDRPTYVLFLLLALLSLLQNGRLAEQ